MNPKGDELWEVLRGEGMSQAVNKSGNQQDVDWKPELFISLEHKAQMKLELWALWAVLKILDLLLRARRLEGFKHEMIGIICILYHPGCCVGNVLA